MKKVLSRSTGIRSLVIPLLAILSLLLIFVIYDVVSVMQSQVPIKSAMTIDLKQGATIRTLATTLAGHKVLDNKFYFLAWARLSGQASHLQAGEYQLAPGQSLADLLNNMVAGNVKHYAITLLEGWTFREMLTEIHSNPVIKKTIDTKDYMEIMSRVNETNKHPEGYFFPETYYVTRNTTDVELLKRAYTAMNTHLQTLWETRDPAMPLTTKYETLILASIVEKESAIAEERPVIAGVFINRLRKGMRLQTDPTVIYGMGDSYKGDIRFKDLRTDTAYNTYTRAGLPPTPIAMPGYASLQAVMHPVMTDNLYFVAINDESGRHEFSSTLAEHQKAVEQYQK